MTRLSFRLAGLGLLLAAGAASAPVQAQTSTAPLPDGPSATAPGTPRTTAPGTPRNGVARGVIRPSRPVDSGIVTPPPAHGQSMPVIRPPGTAR